MSIIFNTYDAITFEVLLRVLVEVDFQCVSAWNNVLLYTHDTLRDPTLLRDHNRHNPFESFNKDFVQKVFVLSSQDFLHYMGTVLATIYFELFVGFYQMTSSTCSLVLSFICGGNHNGFASVLLLTLFFLLLTYFLLLNSKVRTYALITRFRHNVEFNFKIYR